MSHNNGLQNQSSAEFTTNNHQGNQNVQTSESTELKSSPKSFKSLSNQNEDSIIQSQKSFLPDEESNLGMKSKFA